MTKTFQQLIFAALLTVAFGLAGCGGGGGPSPSPSRSVKDLGEVCGVGAAPGTVAYSTLWGPAPDQASQVLQLVDADNAVVRSVAINRQGEANTSHTMTSVTPGVYEFRATLYSQVNGQGSLFAQTSQVVDLCDTEDNTFTVQSVYGSDPTSLTVNPSELAVKEQQSRRFVASPRNTRGEVVFVSPDSVEFSVLGGLGDLTDEGVFTAVNAGTGAVRATHVPTGVNGAAAVEVEIFEIVRGKWTVMVYMNAANDLHPFSTLNMNQLEQVAQNDDVRFVVQWKQSREAWPNSSFDGVRRYLIRPNDTNDIVSDVVQSNLVNDQGQALDMGDPQTLNDFVTWAKTFYPADRFALVIWNHGNGWRRALSENQPVRAFSYDDQYLSSIKTWEMDEAFGSHQFDIIAWDASLMQMLEVAYQARSYADYIVGSEESPPGEGYPYHLVFDNFRDNPDAATETLAQAFVDGMLEFDLYDLRKITQSVVKTSELNALAASVSTLGQALSDNRADLEAETEQVRQSAQAYSDSLSRTYRDLVDVCLIYESIATVPAAVKTACQDVRAKAQAAIVYEGNNAQSPDSHGLSIDFSDSQSFATRRLDYQKLDFAQDTTWDEWLTFAP